MLSTFLKVYSDGESSYSESGCCQNMLNSGNEMIQKAINKNKWSRRNDLLKIWQDGKLMWIESAVHCHVLEPKASDNLRKGELMNQKYNPQSRPTSSV